MSITKFPFHDYSLIGTKLNSKSMFESIEKFSIIDFAIVKVEKPFIDRLFAN